ncbi:MAG TPA: hypothetical protein VN205_01555 [Thermomonas sp.]|nr:hypothetical protein [Thermomonas sp.]
MTKTEQLQQDLDYIAATVRRRDRPAGIPAIYFLWAAIIGVGFALTDFAPRGLGAFWLVCGIGGGLLSWWLGERDARRSGVIDQELGRRHGLHWGIGGIAFALTFLPLLLGRVPPQQGGAGFLFTTGLLYALAGVHLERPMLWSGLLMLAAYALLTVFALPYTWTISGIVIALSLAWAGLSAQRARNAGLPQ